MWMQLPSELATKLERWREESKRIVFTNGVFDLLHPGHVAQLEAAHNFGDVLIVGVNSDASVKLLSKGDGRPILDEAARSVILRALRAVDAVVLFDEPTPLELITAIRPDVLVKGGDYANAEVVGRDVVEANGGSVELIDLISGYSSSAIIAKIRGG
jgi:rfaE bifunctional protein nucleotidyltransferase chain/domain